MKHIDETGDLAAAAQLARAIAETVRRVDRLFRAARLAAPAAIDLPLHVRRDVRRPIARTRDVDQDVEVLEVPATAGAGLDGWSAWLRREAAAFAGQTGAAAPAAPAAPGTGPRR